MRKIESERFGVVDTRQQPVAVLNPLESTRVLGSIIEFTAFGSSVGGDIT